ncbi:MAG: heme o synthase, partial [Micrococcaceae bacterium]
MKLRVVELLLVSTLPTMIFAQKGMPSFGLIIATLFGGTMAAGSANAFNMYLDRDIDRVMDRTKKRPLVTGVLSDNEALAFAWLSGIFSVAFLWLVVNPLSGILAAGAIAFYVIIYTMILKRRTPQNIVWGGIAGCFPVLIGWAAVTNTISWAAIVLFMVIFLWTPPHYWPLSLRYGEDYRRADVPMLGAISSIPAVSQQIILYSWAMVVCSLLLGPVGGAGMLYMIVAIAAGAWFLFEAHRLSSLAIQGAPESVIKPMRLFHASIT